jgi:prevent-host-death family protein
MVIAMLDVREIYPLSDFQRNARQFVEQLQESHKPIVLTVNGKAAVVMQDATSYQELLDELAIARSAAVIRQGMEEAAKGNDRDAIEALEELRIKHDIPR